MCETKDPGAGLQRPESRPLWALICRFRNAGLSPSQWSDRRASGSWQSTFNFWHHDVSRRSESIVGSGGRRNSCNSMDHASEGRPRNIASGGIWVWHPGRRQTLTKLIASAHVVRSIPTDASETDRLAPNLQTTSQTHERLDATM